MLSVVVVSPHCDDGALSVGGIMRELTTSVSTIFLLTVYTISRHIAYRSSQITRDISRIRVEEDRSFCSALSIRYCHLRQEEYACRRRVDLTELFDGRDLLDLPEYKKLLETLSKTIARLNPRFVMCPLSLGNHIDHRMVTSALRAVCRLNLIYYEDQPYSADYCRQTIQEHVALVASGLEKRVFEFDGYEKISLLRFYPSQIGQKEIRKLYRYSSLHSGEGSILCNHRNRTLGQQPPKMVESIWGSKQSLEELIGSINAEC